MDEPLAELVLQHIVSMLQGITTAAGYFTDLGTGYITTEPTQKAPPNTTQYVVLSETEITVSNDTNKTVISEMQITIEIVVPCAGAGRKPANLARRGRADVVRAIKAPLRAQVAGLRSLNIDKTQRLVFDDERYANSVVAQVIARAGLAETITPATP